MSDSNISDLCNMLTALDQQMESFCADTKQQLDHLICKEQMNQLWKLEVESTMHNLETKVFPQCVGIPMNPKDLNEHDPRTEEDDPFMLIAEVEDETNNQESDTEVIPDGYCSVDELSEPSTAVVQDAARKRHSEHANKHRYVNSVQPTSETDKLNTKTGVDYVGRSKNFFFLPCSQCEATYTSRANLWLHEQRRHCDPKIPYHCKVCLQDFSTRLELRQHYSSCSYRPGRRLPYVCAKCGKGFATWDQVMYHAYRHNGRTYSCTVCGLAFNSPSRVTAHMVTHTGEKPFDCPYCDTRFSARSSRTRHLQNYHLPY